MTGPKVNAPCSHGQHCQAFPTDLGGRSYSTCGAIGCPELQRLWGTEGWSPPDRKEGLSFFRPSRPLAYLTPEEATRYALEDVAAEKRATPGLPPLTAAAVILAAVHMQDPEAADLAIADQLLLGGCFLSISADGTVKRIAPELVTIRRPPPDGG